MGATRSWAALGFFLVGTAAVADPAASALTYLLSQQSPDGSFGGATGEQRVVTTVEALFALRAAGQGDTLAAHYAELFLAIAPRPPDSEIELRRELALATTGQRVPFKSLIAHAPGFEAPDALHLALSLRTDVAAGLGSGGDAASTMGALSDRRQVSGCWRWVENDDSVPLTAEALQAFRAMLDVGTPGFGSALPINLALQQATQCLRAAGQPDGSFGSLSATVVALDALLVAPGNNFAVISAARNFLIANQAADGSIGGVRTTAIALRGLVAGKPDWRVATDDLNQPILIFQDPNPLAGVPAFAFVDIQNRSSFPAPATTVRLLLQPLGGGAEVTGAEVALPPLAAGQTASQVTAQLATTTLQGRYRVRAVVDPDGLVAEISEANNTASQTLNVRAEGDLAVTSSGIRFVALGAGQTRIDVTVRNLGVPLSQAVSVGFWKGNPGAGGVQLGSASLPAGGMATNATATVSLQWASGAANGATPIYAVVDEFNVLAEADETNNQAFRFFFPGQGTATDLAVSGLAGGTIPAQPKADKPFVLSVVVLNQSAGAATMVPVAVYEGAVLRGRTEIASIAANGSATATFTLVTPRSVTFRAIVDPDLLLNDSNRGNNSRDFPTGTLLTDPVELGFASGLVPRPQGNGALVTLTVDAQNRGSEAAQTFLRLVDRNDNDKEWARIPLTLGPGETKTLVLGPFAVPPRVASVFACLDPDGLLAEPNENDNCIEQTLGTGNAFLSVVSADVAFLPVGADVGEKVGLQAIIRNMSTTAATAIVEWWLGSPTTPEGVLIGNAPISVPASGQATASLDWVRKDGSSEIYVRVAAVTPAEGNPGDNVASRHLFLDQMLDLGLPTKAIAGTHVRVGLVTGGPTPDTVVAFSALPGQQGVALFHPNSLGKLQLVWRRTIGDFIGDLALVDLDADGHPEILAISTSFSSSTNSSSIALTALNGDGSLKWETHRPSSSNGVAPPFGLGDLNGDGLPDIAYVDGSQVRVTSGADGQPLTTTTLPGLPGSGPLSEELVILDVDGDGSNEILGAVQGVVFLLSNTGQVKWTYVSGGSFGAMSSFGVVDLNLDGVPEIVFPTFRGSLVALNGLTGRVFLTGSIFESWPESFSAGNMRQDGLTCSGVGNDSLLGRLAAFSPELTPIWDVEKLPRTFGVPVFQTTLADLTGKGRPQVIASDRFRSGPVILDGRDGSLLLDAFDTFNFDTRFFVHHSPVVADAYGTGKSQVILGHGASAAGASPAFIYASAHWVKQPSLWPTRVLRKGQMNDNLTLGTDYRWWRGHNTWNDQFDVAPAKLLPDLVVRAGDVSAVPSAPAAGTQTLLKATVNNLGGLTATGVRVAFFDGDPAAGAAQLGTVVLGPIAAHAAVVATLHWTAFPEGLHQIFAVANSDGAIEESGRENNTASARVFVQAGAGLCDAAIDVSSLSATPAVPTAGQSVLLAATVRNLGGLDCPAHVLTVRDGAGGAVIGTAQVPLLAPGLTAATTVTIAAIPGTHVLRFILDEAGTLQDDATDNNVASFQLAVPTSSQPDYRLTALSFSPSPAHPGETVTGNVVVMNQGAAASALSRVGISTGAGALASVTVDPLASSQSAVATFTFVAPASNVTIAALADADNVLAEFDEANNGLAAQLAVQGGVLTLSGAASPSSTLPGAQVAFTVAANVSTASALEVFFDARLMSPSGVSVAAVATAQREVLAPGSSSRTWTLSAGNLVAGAYALRVTASSGGRFLTAIDVPLTVLPETSASTALAVDRGTYHPGEQALLSQRLTNSSRNAVLTGASLTVRVRDSFGTVLYSSTRQVPALAAGAFSETVDLFAISPSLSPGTYVADSSVRDSSGALLAAASAAFVVTYQPQETVRGSISAQSPFPIGPALAATVALTNSGALAVINGTLLVTLVNATTLAVEGTASGTANVAAGGTASVVVSLPTTGISIGQKLLVAQLNGLTLGRLVVTSQRVVDVDPPVISVSGVTDGQLGKQDVAPVIGVSDQSSFTTVFLLDGQPFVAGTTVSAQTPAPHVLDLQATDAFGNSSHLLIRFTIDKAPPVLTLAGVANGAIVPGPVTLSFSGSDANGVSFVSTLTSSGATLNLPSGSLVSVEGDYVWTVVATDGAGNSSVASRSFTLDSTPPVISVAGVVEGASYNHPVSVSFSATDLHPGSVTATLDGAAFVSGATVSTEAAHVLVVTAADQAGNTATATTHFSIDVTAPVIAVGGVADGQLRNTAATIVYSATGVSSVTATLDGLAFGSGATVSAEGAHTLVVNASDAAGNAASATVQFTIDTTSPVVSVSGVTEGAVYNHSVTVTFSATDLRLLGVTATLDGAAFLNGSAVSTEGSHVLVVTAADQAGNTATATRHFSIDVTAPIVTVSGVVEGQLRNTAATIVYSATGASSVTATLDGAGFVSGSTVSVEGAHTFLVIASDAAGNVASTTVHFTIDTTVPVVSVTGVAEGAVYNHSVTVAFSATDVRLLGVSATLDGAVFLSGSAVSTEGAHVVVVTATDQAGNTATATRHFTIDVTPPVITVSGVVEGQLRNTAATIVYSAVGASSLTATVDGVAFATGATVSASGSHTLVVTATDAAGNTASTTVHFTIDVTPPVIAVTGVTSGGLLNHSVTVGFSATDASGASATATLDGAVFLSGATVSAAGDHLLVVTARDGAGNTATASVPFSLDFTAPAITISGVIEGATGASFTPVFSATDAHSVTVSATLDGAAFTSGTLVSSAGAHALLVTAVDGAGNSSTQTRHFTVTATQMALPRFNYAACAFGTLTVSNNASVTGTAGATASVAANGAFTMLNNGRVGGAVVAGGAVSLKNNAVVDGRVYSGGAYSQLNNAIATGGHQTVSPAPSPCECGFNLAAALADATSTNNNALLAGNPAFVGGVLKVQNNSTLTLAAGRYHLASLQVLNNAKLLTAAGAQVQLYVDGNITVGNNSMVGAPVGSPGMFVLSGAGPSGTVSLQNNADVALTLYAPNASVSLSNNSKLYGAVVGRDITLSNNQILVLTGFTQSTPPPLTCP